MQVCHTVEIRLARTRLWVGYVLDQHVRQYGDISDEAFRLAAWSLMGNAVSGIPATYFDSGWMYAYSWEGFIHVSGTWGCNWI